MTKLTYHSLKKEVEKINSEFKYNKPSKALTHWLLKNIFSDYDDDTIKEYNICGKLETYFDEIFIDKENNKILLIQTKYHSPTKTTPAKDVKYFLMGCNKLLSNPESVIREARDDVKDTLVEFKEKIAVPFSIECIFFSTSGYPLGKEFKKLVEDYRVSLKKTKLIRQNKASIAIELYDFKKITEFYESINSSIDKIGPVELEFNPQESFPKTNGKFEILTFTLTNSSIFKLKKYGKSLFEINVRYRIRSGINSGIYDTLTDDKDKFNFWLFNNGVYLIAEDFRVKNNVLKLVNPQIINGCQTVETIWKTGEDNSKIGVLARVIKPIKKLTSKQRETFFLMLAERTNTQNRVKLSDLRSNDEIQKSLAREFLKRGKWFEKLWFYERKRGAWEQFKPPARLNKRDYEKITKEQAAQCVLAFMGFPEISRTSINKLFDKEEKIDDEIIYDLIFSEDASAEQIFLPTYIFKKVVELSQKDKDSEQLYFLRYAKYYLVSFISYLLSKKYNLPIKQSKMLCEKVTDISKEEIDKLISRYYYIVRELLEDHISSKKEDQTEFNESNYFKKSEVYKVITQRLERKIRERGIEL